ncbi:serine/threonine-protein kinase 31-like [Rhopilema esculentum]|uniref:serine/threonine-protein kinase 31-like n=1 Tax=Rhopilema esculentum TaxID=499914 RepID=UPI0031D7F284|eukprot:gene12599-3303_t
MANKVGSEQSYDVYVARIPADYDEPKLRQLFDAIGTVKGVSVKPGKGDHTLNYAFIKFATESDALCAVRYMNNHQLGDSKILVNYRKKEGSTSGSESGGSSSSLGGFKSPGVTKGSSTGFKGFGGTGFVNNESFPKNGFGSPNEVSYNNSVWDESADSASKQSNPSLASSGFKKLTEEKVIIVHVDHLSKIWAQPVSEENARRINRLSEELQSECRMAHKVTGQPPYSKIFGCKFSVDDQWYRCKVHERLTDSKVKISYIDYGNCEVVDEASLVELTSSLAHMPPCAEEYNLRIKPINEDENSEEFKKGLDHMRDYVFDKMVNLLIESGSNEVTKATLVATNEDIIENLIISGHAVASEKKPPKEKVLQPLRSPRITNPIPNGIHDKQSDELKNQLADLTAQLKKSKAAEEKLQGDIRSLKQKNSLLEQSVALADSKLRSMSNAVVNEQFLKMIQKVNDLKSLRDDLHLEGTLHPTLKKAVQLLTEDVKSIKLSKISSYEKLLSAEEDLSSSQTCLKSCTGADGLDSLVQARDQKREKYLHEIDAFLTETRSLDFDERRGDLAYLLDDIEREFTSFLSNEGQAQSVTDAMQAYEKWKADKIDDVREIQRNADHCCLALANTLEIVKMKLSIKAQPILVDIGNEAAEQGDVDELLQEYSQAVAAESSKLKELNIDTEGKSMISNLVSSLIHCINGELEDIETLSGRLIDSYEGKKIEIEKWIATKPDISKLKETKASLKSLKSKFRHKQADRKDCEEDSDESDQLAKIEDEIELLRNQIHSMFVEEKRLLHDLSQVTERHFPELKVRHPELGITSFMESNGLLQTRELEHYDHHSLPLISSASAQPVVFKTKFNQKDCVLKEYCLNWELTKDVIKSRMFAYGKVEHAHSVQLDALFFDKAGRKAYLQTPYFGYGNLNDFVAQKPGPEEIVPIFHSILTALVAIHDQGCIHGSVSPTRVLMQDSNIVTAVLKEPNFSKDESQRFKELADRSDKDSCYPNFNANVEPASMELDAYCFGLLMFWAHFPTTQHIGTPLQMLERIPKDDAVCDVLMGLLAEDKTKRMSLQEALDHPFFSSIKLRSQSPSEELLSVIKDPGDSFAIIEMNESAETKDLDTSIEADQEASEEQKAETCAESNASASVPDKNDNDIVEEKVLVASEEKPASQDPPQFVDDLLS